MFKAALLYAGAVVVMSLVHLFQPGVEVTSARGPRASPDLVAFPILEKSPAAAPAIVTGYVMIPELQSI
jgi:hypothetical protein